MYKWQSIKTAPKDGKRIIIYSTDKLIMLAYHLFDDDKGDAIWFNGRNSFKATHWCELPSPPIEELPFDKEAKYLQVRVEPGSSSPITIGGKPKEEDIFKFPKEAWKLANRKLNIPPIEDENL